MNCVVYLAVKISVPAISMNPGSLGEQRLLVEIISLFRAVYQE